MRKLWAITAIGTVLAFVPYTSPAGSAPGAVPKATGGVAMAAPAQYASFAAFDDENNGDRGTVRYTNFEYAAAGTGVWTVAGTTLTFVLGVDYPHTLFVDTVTPTSTTSATFTGHGFYNGNPTVTWTVAGSVQGSTVSFHMAYTEGGYTLDATGTIAGNGSMSGTANDSVSQFLTWSAPAGSAHEVLSYTADVTCATVGDQDATFGFVIPSGFVGLSGLNVTVEVHDGGSPGVGNDTWGHGVAEADCSASVANYPITSGNLVVH
jgi:hypothetical protein